MQHRSRLSPFLLSFVLLSNVFGAADLHPNRIREIAATLRAQPSGLGEPATNRVVWDKLAQLPQFQNVVSAAGRDLSQPLQPISDDLYLEYSKTGNRNHWQDVEFSRRYCMAAVALAECLEHKGRFLPQLESIIETICAERTWVYPAHDRSLSNFNGTIIDIDLGSSAVGWDLATIHYLLRDELSPKTQDLIRTKLHERILKPYRNMAEGRIAENGWMRRSNNWNAVCHAGVIGTALVELEPREDRAFFIASAEFYMRFFLGGFGKDGYCSEGVGYWNYGFGNFIMLTEMLRRATDGKLDLLNNPAAQRAALFSRRIEMINGVYPAIADCHPASTPDSQIATYICQRMQLPGCDSGDNVFKRPARNLFATALFASMPEQLPVISNNQFKDESRLRTWFDDGGVLICRPGSKTNTQFAVSLKGGHNNEQHNHNDVGSYIVVLGNSVLIADPGAEVYTARTFSSKRYDSDVLNSFGHDVPVLAGKLQRKGEQARAKVLKTEFTDGQDTLSLDIASAYGVPELKKLERTFVYSRANPSLRVTDSVKFSTPQTFETALITWSPWKAVSTNELELVQGNQALRVKIDTGGIPIEITQQKLEADVVTPQKATRIGITLKQPVTNASVKLTIAPKAP